MWPNRTTSKIYNIHLKAHSSECGPLISSVQPLTLHKPDREVAMLCDC